MSKGLHFYPNHLLLGELYTTASAEEDEIAERILGTQLCAEVSLTASPILDGAARFLSLFPPVMDPMARALVLECAYLDMLGAIQPPTRGWEDLLGAHCSAHERAVYLLKRNQAQPALP